jgi:hypothetical protein
MAKKTVNPQNQRRAYKTLNTFQKARIIQASMDGKSQNELVKLFDASKGQVSRLLSKYNKTGNVNRQEGSGRPRKTNAREDRMIMRLLNKNRFISASDIKSELSLNVSDDTIERRILESGEFKSYWAAKKPFLSKAQMKRRLQWSLEHRGWTIEQWRRILWTDKSPYVLRFNCKKKVWRRHNERYDPKCTLGTVKHDRKINVWGSFAAHGVGMLHRIQGIMDRFVYLDIVENCLIPSRDLLFADTGTENCLVQQDNDPKHTAIIIKEYWQDNSIAVLDWPSQSPDLNPIENLWSILDHNLKDRRPNNEAELFEELKRGWEALPESILTRLVDSMPRRIEAV